MLFQGASYFVIFYNTPLTKLDPSTYVVAVNRYQLSSDWQQFCLSDTWVGASWPTHLGKETQPIFDM